MESLMDLRGKRVLITGASRGVGEALAECLSAAGARVALVARSAEALETLARRLGGKAYPCDLANPEAVAQLLERVETDGGPVDILVNNAALEVANVLDEMTPQEVRDVLQVDLLTPVELCRQMVARLRARGSTGHIVNVSSMAGNAPLPGLSTYSAAKAGLSHFTAGFRAEVAPLGIGATLVELGPVRTAMLESVMRFPPTFATFQRIYRLRLAVDVPRETIAVAILRAIERGHAHVRLPQRSFLFPWLSELPRLISRWVLWGISWRG